jgi:hypothetical protein
VVTSANTWQATGTHTKSQHLPIAIRDSQRYNMYQYVIHKGGMMGMIGISIWDIHSAHALGVVPMHGSMNSIGNDIK